VVEYLKERWQSNQKIYYIGHSRRQEIANSPTKELQTPIKSSNNKQDPSYCVQTFHILSISF